MISSMSRRTLNILEPLGIDRVPGPQTMRTLVWSESAGGAQFEGTSSPGSNRPRTAPAASPSTGPVSPLKFGMTPAFWRMLLLSSLTWFRHHTPRRRPTNPTPACLAGPRIGLNAVAVIPTSNHVDDAVTASKRLTTARTGHHLRRWHVHRLQAPRCHRTRAGWHAVQASRAFWYRHTDLTGVDAPVTADLNSALSVAAIANL